MRTQSRYGCQHGCTGFVRVRTVWWGALRNHRSVTTPGRESSCWLEFIISLFYVLNASLYKVEMGFRPHKPHRCLTLLSVRQTLLRPCRFAPNPNQQVYMALLWLHTIYVLWKCLLFSLFICLPSLKLINFVLIITTLLTWTMNACLKSYL